MQQKKINENNKLHANFKTNINNLIIEFY